MPTKKKRVGFIPRDHVMKIISALSVENNLSNSKIISILVEEALIKRGIYNIDSLKNISEDNSNHFLMTNLKCNVFDDNMIQTNYFNKKITTNDYDYFDLETYEKFIMFLKFKEMINKYED